LVTASDGGGSIRIPASLVGAFGLKPSYGRIPRGSNQAWEFGDTSHWGPLTKTVEDGALYMDLTIGPHRNDPNSLPHPGYSYVDKLKEPLPKKLKIAFSPDLGFGVVQSDIARQVEAAAKAFSELGHEVELLSGGPPDAAAVWAGTGSFFSAARLSEFFGTEQEALIGRGFRAGIERGFKMTPERWQRASVIRNDVANWVCDVFDQYDLLLTPTVPFDPYPPGGPYPREVEGREQPPSSAGTFTIPFNLSWHPAATVRAGLSDAGYPVGLQIVGPRHRDDLVLQASYAFEQARPWHPEWPDDRIG
jgi:aspartyl-tRNA(Asn)/glutamyl-tRNA(Gln) amidotransferase subunit A